MAARKKTARKGKEKPARKSAKKPARRKRPTGGRLAPAQRLLDARTLLATPHGATLEDLQERLACGRHTAMRALGALKDMGEVLDEEQEGRRIRYRILGAKKGRETKLSTAHVIAVAAAREAMSFLEGTGLKEAFDEVVDLLEGQLAPKAFEQLGRLKGRVVLLEDGPWAKVDRTDVIDGLLTGLARNERVTLKGTGSDGARTFDFEPYTLVFWRSGIYVAGYSHHHMGVRLFGLDRLTDGEWKRGETFEVPETWDARAVYGGSFDPFDGPATNIRVQFAPKVARYVGRRAWTRTMRIEEHADERVVLEVVARGTKGASNWVLGFGEHAEVLAPASLRNEIAAIARKMAALYEPKGEAPAEET